MLLVGTALMIANNINDKFENNCSYVFNTTTNSNCSIVCSSKNNNLNSKKIGFSSIRGGNLVGEHSVLFLGENEKIEITHTAYSRNIYIEGALHAAKFIINKKNGLYNMYDLTCN